MSDIWSKALRAGPSGATPRSKSYSNNRYGGQGRGGADDEVDSADSCASKRAPARQPGVHDRPWKDMPPIQASGRTGAALRTRSGYGRPPVPRQNSGTDDGGGDAVSVAESDDVSVATEDDYREGAQEGESVQVFVRVRPINGTELAESEHYNCTRIYGDRTVSVELRHRTEPYQFKFDCVLPETTTQQEIFERAGRPIVDNCMGGYNSTIFAYGQTGAGKTYTMQGPAAATGDLETSDERGLAPRVFEYLFSEIDKAQDEQSHSNLTFCCRCSMLEIYNEVITDLLNPTATNLQIREDIKRGCYVEGLSEQLIQNVPDAMRLMRTGAENRHVGETRLNRESSRSHSVFACTLERHSKSAETGVTNVLFSRLNLIDLAGSERIHGGEHGGSQATGRHFKEACHINKSLTTLGRVIMELVEAQRSAGRSAGTSSKPPTARAARHVPYRDSRLTFLLQDSLGGNAKTLMVANISPSSVSAQETLSTLQFMSRAKCIRNRATINLDARGDVVLLQREIVRLNGELDNLRKGYTEPAIQEAKELRTRLEEMCASRGQTEARLLGLEKENQHLKAERRRLDHKMAQIQKGAGQLDTAIFSLTAKVMHHESLAAAATEKGLAAERAEHELQLAKLQHALAAQEAGAQELMQQKEELQQQLEKERSEYTAAADKQLTGAQHELQAAQSALGSSQAECDALRQQLERSQMGQDELAVAAEGARAALQAQLDAAESRAAELQAALDSASADAAEAREEAAEALAAAKSVNAGLDEQVQQLQRRAEEAEANVALGQEAAEKAQADASAALEDAAAQRRVAEERAVAADAERDALLQQLQESRAASQQAAAARDELQQQLEALESRANSERSMGEATAAQVGRLQEQLAEAAAASTAAAAAAEARVSELGSQLAEAAAAYEASRAQICTLEATLEEANAALKDRGTALELATETSCTLQAQLEAAASASAARAETLGHELAAARESARSRQEELLKQVAEVHVALSAAQQDAERLQDELDGARSDESLLRAQLAEAEGQADRLRSQVSGKAADCDQLRKKLASADATAASLRTELDERMLQAADMQRALQAAEEAAREQQAAATEQVNALKRELMDRDQALETSGLDLGHLQRRLDEQTRRAADKAAALDAHKEETKSLKATLCRLEGAARQRDAELADRTATVAQLQSDLEAMTAKMARMQEELNSKDAQLRVKLSAHELQLKEQIVYNVRQKADEIARNRQAMNEIRKVINWAQQAPAGGAANSGTPQETGVAAVAAASSSSSSGGGHRTGIGAAPAGPLVSAAAAAAASGVAPLPQLQLSRGGSEGLLPTTSGGGGSRSGGGSVGGGADTVEGMMTLLPGGGGSGGGSVHDATVLVRQQTRMSGSCGGAWSAAMQQLQLAADNDDDDQAGNDDAGSDCTKLLAPERATSPLRLSTGEDGLMVQLPSPTQRKSARRADRRGSLRSGSDHHNFSTAALALKMQQQEQQGTAADDGDGDRKSMHDA